MRSPKSFLVLLFLSVLSFAATLFSQTSTGEANWTVTDQSGAIVSGATVTLTNEATKIENRATTNASGYFVFINVQPGSYVLRVEKQGFKTAQTAPFQISVNEAVTQGLALGVGATAEVVQVNAEATLVDS